MIRLNVNSNCMYIVVKKKIIRHHVASGGIVVKKILKAKGPRLNCTAAIFPFFLNDIFSIL